jgi:hypothetical protein
MVERVGDLQYGERYELISCRRNDPCLLRYRFINMDYIIFDALRDCSLRRVAISYDIYCKWSIHAEKRARNNFPPAMSKAFLALSRRGFVPKLHLYAHGDMCRTNWSFNYHKGVGRTDGESTERDWAAAVLAALQTAEMNPGARHQALDDHWIDRDFRRILGLSESPYALSIPSLRFDIRRAPAQVAQKRHFMG